MAGLPGDYPRGLFILIVYIHVSCVFFRRSSIGTADIIIVRGRGEEVNKIPRKVAEGSAEGVVSAEGSRKGGVLET